MSDFTSLPEEQQRDALLRFLRAISAQYLADEQAMYFEDVVPAVLSHQSDASEVEIWVEVAKVHFLPSYCEACGIYNEEAFAENNDTGEEGAMVDYELTADNLASLLDQEGNGSLYEHLRQHLPDGEWQNLSGESERRIFTSASARGTIILVTFRGPGAAVAEACAEVLEAEDCADIEAMPLDEALGYAFTLLIANGVDDPEQFLRQKGVLE